MTESPKVNFVDGQKRTPFRAYTLDKKRKSRTKASRAAGIHRLGQTEKTSDIPDDLIGEPNECLVVANGLSAIALLDSGSMVSTITSQYWNEHFPDQPVHPLDDLLTLSGAGGLEIPYWGYVEVDTKLSGVDASPFPFLVIKETEYNSRVPVLIGTNILNKILDGLVNVHGVRFAQKARLPSAMNCALSVMQTARKTLGKRKNVISEVHLCETTELAPGEGRRFAGRIKVDTPVPKQVALVNGIKEYQAGGIEVTPTAICVELHSHYTAFEMLNWCTRHVTLPRGTLVANLTQVQLMEMKAVQGHLQDEDHVFQCFGPDFKQDELHQWLLTSVRDNIDIFSATDLDLGRAEVTKHPMILQDYIPFKEQARRVPPHMYDEVHQYLRQMLDLDVTDHQTALGHPMLSWCASLMKNWDFVLILDGSTSAQWLMPTISRGSTRLWTHSGTPGVLRVQSYATWIKNAPAIFQRLMQWVLGDLHLNGCVVYIDDLVIYSKTEEEHEMFLRKVFEKVREAGLKLSKKSAGFQDGDQVPRPCGLCRRYLLLPQQDSSCIHLACTN